MLTICRDGYWPGITPDRIWDLPYELWGRLALACDAITEAHEEQAAELRRMKRG